MPINDPFEEKQKGIVDPFDNASGASAGSKKPKEPTLTDRLGGLVTPSIGGAIGGAFTPEATAGLGKAMQFIPYPPVRAAGKVLSTIAPEMGMGARVAGSVGGALSPGVGLLGDLTARGFGATPKEAAAFGEAAEIVTPMFQKAVTDAIGAMGRKAGEPIWALAKAVSKSTGVDVEKMSAAQKKFLAGKISEIRGGEAGGTSERAVMRELEAGAGAIRSEAEQRAGAVRSEGERLAGRQRIGEERLPEIASERRAAAQSQLQTVGDVKKEVTDIGNDLREPILSRFNEESLSKDQTYVAQKKVRDDVVSAKESAGETIENLQEYKDTLEALNKKLLIGKKAMSQRTRPVSEQGVLAAYGKIREAMISKRVKIDNPAYAEELKSKGLKVVNGVDPNTGEPALYREFPTSFDALDDVRRKLADAAFGQGKEGYEALGQSISKEYYAKISAIQSKFAGEAQDTLQSNYELASKFLEKFKGAKGKAVTAFDKVDSEQFVKSPSSIPRTFFSDRQGVADLQKLTGNPSIVNKAAGDYVANSLRNKSAKEARAWLDRNSDFLSAPEISAVKQKAENYIAGLERAEATAGRAEKAGTVAGKMAVGLETGAAKESEKIVSQATDRAQKILGDAYPERRISEVILSGSPELWNEVAPIIAKSPAGKQALSKALNSVMADRVASGRQSALDTFVKDVRPALETTNLVPKGQLDKLQRQIEEAAAGMPEKQKVGFIQEGLGRILAVQQGIGLSELLSKGLSLIPDSKQ